MFCTHARACLGTPVGLAWRALRHTFLRCQSRFVPYESPLSDDAHTLLRLVSYSLTLCGSCARGTSPSDFLARRTRRDARGCSTSRHTRRQMTKVGCVPQFSFTLPCASLPVRISAGSMLYLCSMQAHFTARSSLPNFAYNLLMRRALVTFLCAGFRNDFMEAVDKVNEQYLQEFLMQQQQVRATQCLRVCGPVHLWCGECPPVLWGSNLGRAVFGSGTFSTFLPLPGSL